MMSLRCRSCNIDFHDNASLEVHHQYAHSNAGESLSSSDTSRPSTEPDVESAASVESAADSYYKFQNLPDRGTGVPSAAAAAAAAAVPNNASAGDDAAAIMTAISPGNASDGRDFHISQSLAAHQHHLHQQQHQLQLHHQAQAAQQHHQQQQQHLQLLHFHQQQAQSQHHQQQQQQPPPPPPPSSSTSATQHDLLYDVSASATGIGASTVPPTAAPPAPPPPTAPLGHPQAGYDGFTVVNSHHNPHHPHHHHLQQPHQEFARSPHNAAYAAYADHHRFHPYYKTGVSSSAFGELQAAAVTAAAASSTGAASCAMMPPAPALLSSAGGGLLRCDKCDFQTVHSEHLAHHLNVAHQGVGSLNLNVPPFGARFANGGAEPQAEILDLDSHKVHVYQPPNGEDSPDEEHRAAIDPWQRHHQHRQQQRQPHPHPHHQHHQSASTSHSSPAHQQQHQQQQQHQNGGTPNGRGTTPLPSPDFGSVSTTTDNVESSSRSPYYEHGGAVANAHISSTENGGGGGGGGSCAVTTGRGSSKGGKSTNGAWKSNEARRPKTYNCSACNKWFTSSGHLKRHYNTTLHKNAVKQSGAPDPATLPVSHHHHPQKDPTYATPGRHSAKGCAAGAAPTSTPMAESPDSMVATTTNVKLEPGSFIGRNSSSSHVSTTMSSQPPPQQQQQQHHHQHQSPTTPTHQASSNGGGVGASAAFPPQRRHSPNLMAGPSELPGGLPQLQHLPLHHLHHRSQHPSYPMHLSSADLIRSPSPNTTTTIITTAEQQQPQPLLPPPPPQHLPHSNHLSFPPPLPPVFGHTPTMAPSHSMQFFPHMSTKIYPNFQSPHVSTTHRVTTTSSLLTGSNLTDVLINDADAECADSSKLPSFACLPKNTWNQAHLDQILGTLETTSAAAAAAAATTTTATSSSSSSSSTSGESNVGGQFTSTKAMEAMLQRASTSTTTTTTTASAAAGPADAFRCRVKREPAESATSDDENAPQSGQQQRRRRGRRGLRVNEHPPPSPTPGQSSPPDEEESVTSSTNPVVERLRFGSGPHYRLYRGGSPPDVHEGDGDGDCLAGESGLADLRVDDYGVGGGGGGGCGDSLKPAFSCERCQKRFNKACYLTQHNKSFHSGVKPFKCSRCGKRFPDADQYSAHWAKHSGDKPYKCDACPKAFNHKTDLRRHACLHSDTRPFSCDLCGKGFIRKDHMLKHRETHKNRKNGCSSAAVIRAAAGAQPVRSNRRLKRSKAAVK